MNVRRSLTLLSLSVAGWLGVPGGPGAFAATFYISPAGNDGNSGTLAAPWATLQKAANTASAGDTVLARGGNYAATSGVIFSRPGITFKAYPGERPVFSHNGGEAAGGYGFVIDASNITLEGLTLLAVSAGDGQGIIGFGKTHTNIVLRNNKIGFIALPTGSASGADGIKVLPSISSDAWKKADTALNALIEGNEIYNCPGEAIDHVAVDGVTIRNNYIHHSINGIIWKGGSRNFLVENNLVYNTGWAAISFGTSTGIDWVTHDAKAGNYDAKNSIVRNNVIILDSDNPLPTSDHRGIWLGGATQSEVYHNSIYGGSSGIMVTTAEWVTVTPPYQILRSLPSKGSNRIFNNIVWKPGGGVITVKSGSEIGLDLRNNLTTDPKFANPAGRDLHLLTGSPAIDGAIPVAARTADKDGRTISGPAWDIGAYEYERAGKADIQDK